MTSGVPGNIGAHSTGTVELNARMSLHSEVKSWRPKSRAACSYVFIIKGSVALTNKMQLVKIHSLIKHKHIHYYAFRRWSTPTQFMPKNIIFACWYSTFIQDNTAFARIGALANKQIVCSISHSRFLVCTFQTTFLPTKSITTAIPLIKVDKTKSMVACAILFAFAYDLYFMFSYSRAHMFIDVDIVTGTAFKIRRVWACCRRICSVFVVQKFASLASHTRDITQYYLLRANTHRTKLRKLKHITHLRTSFSFPSQKSSLPKFSEMHVTLSRAHTRRRPK